MDQASSAALHRPTAVLMLADGTALVGHGVGATGQAIGEVCFNTAPTGYQEILTDPSYADQIVCFTTPHIGNVGTNQADGEDVAPAARSAARGAVLRCEPTPPSNWRSEASFDAWMAERGIVGIWGVDTRLLTARIREEGMAHAVIAHDPSGAFDHAGLQAQAAGWPGIAGADLASKVTSAQAHDFDEDSGVWRGPLAETEDAFDVVVLDYGVKRAILNKLADVGARATVLPADSPAEAVLARNPDGVVFANGPGDPAATAQYAGGPIKAIVDSGTPCLGICLGHQMLALALGAQTVKMAQGHHGANHPVKEHDSGRVEIVSMNHGFAVDPKSLPEGVRETHVSLFDGTNCGLEVAGRPILSVQHHPEASPGPHDAFGVFTRFADLMREAKTAKG